MEDRPANFLLSRNSFLNRTWKLHRRREILKRTWTAILESAFENRNVENEKKQLPKTIVQVQNNSEKQTKVWKDIFLHQHTDRSFQ